jgi:hypothetical protein
MLLLPLVTALAADPLDRAAYAARYPLADANHPDAQQVQRCLTSWGSHPFTTPESQAFRVLASSVRVMGFGSTEAVDDVATSYPQLIVVRPNVSVMTRTTWKFLNPNGWYCFDTSVTVLAKGEIELGCGTRLADGSGSATVIGSSERAGGVTVLGTVEVRETPGCPK